MKNTNATIFTISLVLLFGVVANSLQAGEPSKPIVLQNGWFTTNGHIVWGYGLHNAWWRAGQRPNITRRAPNEVRPNRTEDLDKLTDAMLRFGFPGFEHNFGLWYDRRRDAHDTARRNDAHVVPPFLEQPWKRSGQGKAWDGLSKYDLTQYNDWYFERLRQFAALCDRKGTILFHNNYMQHNLLETDAHYVDFPWRATNCIQKTDMPNRNPAANVFYDVSHPVRRQLHRAYIRKCLDELGNYHNVVFLCSEEYTGPRSFMEFWLDTIFQWEKEKNRKVRIGLSGCKDLLDAILAKPKYRDNISLLDLRYWWYAPDGKLVAPPSGHQIPGRYIFIRADQITPEQFYRQTSEYRRKYPDKALLLNLPGTRQHAWAGLMGGGSILVGSLSYPKKQDPPHYIAPEKCLAIQPTYDFIRQHLSTTLAKTRPCPLILDHAERNWCLADANKTYLVYALHGGSFRLDLSKATGSFKAQWFDPRTGRLSNAAQKTIEAGQPVKFTSPDDKQDWALLLERVK